MTVKKLSGSLLVLFAQTSYISVIKSFIDTTFLTVEETTARMLKTGIER